MLAATFAPVCAQQPLTLAARASDLVANRSRRLRTLFDCHFDFTWALLRRLGLSHEDADDAVQEVFIVAARRLDQIATGSERAYLASTAIKVASTVRRGLKRRREDCADEALLECALDPAPWPDEAAELHKARRMLDAVLDTLDPDLRTVFVLFELEGLTLHEIADLLSLRLGTVKSRLRRARERFNQSADELKARCAEQRVSA